MLVTILGGLGSGKTLLMSIIAQYTQKEVVANYYLEVQNTQCTEFNLNKFLQAKYENCIILMDEAYTYLESRISSNETNRIMSYILFQSRKKDVTIYITAQLFSTIDKRFRELTDILIIADSRLNYNSDDFNYSIIIEQSISRFSFEYTKCLCFFQLYNTKEIILNDNAKLLFDTKEANERLEEIERYAKMVEEHYKSKNIKLITQNLVNLFIKTHKEIPKFLSTDIYTIIKLNKKKKIKKRTTKNERT